MEPYFEGLNPSQFQAVNNTDGPCLVIAGAGSGKTRVLTFRIAHLLAKSIPSYKILSLTFTNKAAKEMKERIVSIVGEEKAKDLWMGTFHSVFAKILRFEAASLGFNSNFTIYDSQDSKSLLTKIINELNLDKDTYKPGLVASTISKAKNNLVTAEAYQQNSDYYKNDSFNKVPQIGEIYKIYQARCKKADAMDFDDLLMYTNILFRDNSEVLKKYQKRFQYILVDEYQDTNYSQYLIVKKLAQPENNLCVVGDDAQSIYSFRGAKIENILKFGNDYPNFNMFKLEQNYRSTQVIVQAANSLIKKNSKQIPKNTFSEQEVGSKIKLVQSSTDIEEGFAISRLIAQKVQEGEGFHEFAILYRTNAQSRIFEEALNKLRIPCKIHGGLSFFQRKEIKDVLSYLRLCINPNDEEAISRIINYPARGIGQTSVDKLTILAQRNQISIWDVLCNIELATDIFNRGTITKIQEFRELMKSFRADISNADAYSLTNRIIEQSGIYKDLKADTSIEGKNRFDNVQELLNGVKEFIEQETDEIYLPNYLEKIALLTDINDEEKDKANKVTLMTVHSSKGLEFGHCFLVGLEENLFPSTMNLSGEKEIEEERRLFYVALTRAKRSAVLSYATSRRKWGNLTTCAPSRFISEIDSVFVESDVPMMSFQKEPSTNMLDQYRTSKKEGALFSNFKKPVKAQPNMDMKDFVPDLPQNIKQGCTILHPNFGQGFVKEITGKFPDSVAFINFDSGEDKKLLLKFAKLKVLN